MMNSKSQVVSRFCLLLALAPLQVGCSDDGVEPDRLLSVSLSPTDSTIFVGDAVVYEARARYESGTRPPDSVTWTVSNPGVLLVTIETGSSATVTGIERGEGFVIAEVDEQLVDSVHVAVVGPGDVRWRADTEGASGWGNTAALDDLARIYVSGQANGLYAYSTSGELLFTEPSCYSVSSPSVAPNGTAYLTGHDCTQARNADGSLRWSLPIGAGIEGGVAVTSDGSVVLLHNVADGASGAAVVSLISAGGLEAWRDTLGVTDLGLIQESPASVGTDGSIYAAWMQDYLGTYWVSRVTSAGITRWTVPLSGPLEHQTVAIVEGRVFVAYSGGLAVYDTLGTLLWEQAVGSYAVSSPTIDAGGNILVQSGTGLLSYDPDGSLRWSADSLRHSCSQSSGAPTLLQDRQLVVPCEDSTSGSEVCAVNSEDGSLLWRSNVGGDASCSSPTVAQDGTIYAVFETASSSSELVALWNRVPPLREGWPTEGGGMGRLRRQH